MRDKLGRTIDYLRLSVTDRCNCRCLYCMPSNGVALLSHDDILSFEEMRDIVSAATILGVHKVRLTGGEPLVRRDITTLVRMLAEVDGVDELVMTTNATLLAPLAAGLFESGLSRLNISLDTLDAVRYAAITRRGRLSDALAGIQAADAAGFKHTKINCVLIGGINDADIRSLASLSCDSDLSVRFIELMRMGECAMWPQTRFVSADEVLRALPGLVPLGQDGVAELYQMPGWRGTIGLIRPVTHCFCESCDRIRITADGMLKTCLHSQAEVSLRGLSREELVKTLREAIQTKPRGHILDSFRISESARAMNEIGG